MPGTSNPPVARLVLSQREKVILLLHEVDRFRDEAEVPMRACQEGLASALQTQVHNASRALSALQGEGLVIERLAHIRGAGRRRRAYFLTEKGERAAAEISRDLLAQTVVVAEGGEEREMPVERALGALRSRRGRSAGLVDLVQAAGAEGRLDISALRPEGAPPPAPVSHALGRPVDPLFSGRSRELSSLLEQVERGGTAVLWGIPGIGKSALGSRLFDALSPSRPCFWYTIREWDGPASLLRELAGYLRGQGITEAAEAFGRGKGLADLFPALSSDLSKWRGVLILDDVHKASGELELTVNMVVEAARLRGAVGTVLITRTLSPSLSLARPDTSIMELGGLDDAAAEGILRELGTSDPERVLRLSHGHPLILRMSPSSELGPMGTINTFVEEVWASLPAAEKGALEQLSVYRAPVEVVALAGTDGGAVASLRRRGLILEEEGLRAHELVRERIYAMLSRERRLDLHRQAAQHYLGQASGRSALEAFHHRLRSDDRAGALTVLEEKGDMMVEEGPEEVLGALSACTVAAEDGGHPAVCFWKGEAATALGRMEEAQRAYGEGLRSVEEGSAWRGRLLEGLANVQREGSRLQEALDTHAKALEEYARQGNLHAQAREWLTIGSLYRRTKEAERGREAARRAMELLPQDRSIQAAGLNNLAMIDWGEGRLAEAEERLLSSVRLAHQARDASGEARGLENLAMLHQHRCRMEEAVMVLREAAATYLRAGSPRDAARAVVSAAATLRGLGRGDDAIALLEEAVRSPPRRPEGRWKEALAVLLLAKVETLRGMGELRRAAAEGQEALSRVPPSRRPRLLLEMALAHDGLGELDRARDLLERAERELRERGEQGGLVAVLLSKGGLAEKEGDERGAAEIYRAAAWEAERSMDRRGEAAARESLAVVLGPEGQREARRAIELYEGLGMRERGERLRGLQEGPDTPRGEA